MAWKNQSVLDLVKTHQSDNPIELVRELARVIVLEAFNKGWIGPPFNPIELAQLMGYSVHPNESIVDARTIMTSRNKFIIEYNPSQKESRINFSIAHEIGHTLFPDCGETIRNRSDENDKENWELEFLCNIAASELLLPYAEFSSEANEKPLSLNSLIELSKRYRASIESVFLRFCEVVEKPCTVIIASYKDVDQKELIVEYSKSSRSASLRIDPGSLIPTSSKALECINPGWTSYSLEQWDIFGETKYHVYSIGLSQLKKFNKDRVGILLFPEFYSSKVENKIYTVYGDATKPRGIGNKIIVQIINSSGGLGFGFGRSMSKNWPESKKAVNLWQKDKEEFVLGNSRISQLNNDTFVFQMLAQKGIFGKNGEIPLKYDSLRKCLLSLAEKAKQLDASVHMPQIGVGQAKGNWSIIEGMIYEILISRGINVTLYLLPGSNMKSENKVSTLTLFDENTLYE